MKVHMTWGQGPDVVLSLEGTPLILQESPDFDRNRFLYGVITKGGVDLTTDQAHELGVSLLEAAQRAKELSNKVCD